MTDVTHDDTARQLTLLGIVLQALHVLFGITAIMSFVINSVQAHKAKETIYESQIRWQQWTFLSGFAGYISGFWVFSKSGNYTLLLFVGMFVLYRIATSVYYWTKRRAITRLF